LCKCDAMRLGAAVGTNTNLDAIFVFDRKAAEEE
jgi:hypothetical protein